MNWDWVLTVLIIGTLLLAIIVKITGKTLTELFSEIRDFFQDKGEDVADIATNSYYG